MILEHVLALFTFTGIHVRVDHSRYNTGSERRWTVNVNSIDHGSTQVQVSPLGKQIVFYTPVDESFCYFSSSTRHKQNPRRGRRGRKEEETLVFVCLVLYYYYCCYYYYYYCYPFRIFVSFFSEIVIALPIMTDTFVVRHQRI